MIDLQRQKVYFASGFVTGRPSGFGSMVVHHGGSLWWSKMAELMVGKWKTGRGRAWNPTISLEATPTMTSLPPTRPRLLKAPPPPNVTKLGSINPLTHDALGDIPDPNHSNCDCLDSHNSEIFPKVSKIPVPLWHPTDICSSPGSHHSNLWGPLCYFLPL
jgi:hypothetical protein